MINPASLRIGNWIYPTGRSKYVVVTGLLLGMMEKNEDLCKEFEGIELTGGLLTEAGFEKTTETAWKHNSLPLYIYQYTSMVGGEFQPSKFILYKLGIGAITEIKSLDHLQNLTFYITGYELPLPESAKIIPEEVGK